MKDKEIKSWESYAHLLKKDNLEQAISRCTDKRVQVRSEIASIQVRELEIRLHIPSYHACAQMLNVEPISSEGACFLENLSHTLKPTGTTLTIMLGDRLIGRLGIGRELGSVARLMKIRQLEKADLSSNVVTVRDKKTVHWRAPVVAAFVTVGWFVYRLTS